VAEPMGENGPKRAAEPTCLASAGVLLAISEPLGYCRRSSGGMDNGANFNETARLGGNFLVGQP
jgi:hypothetical protein